MTRDGEPSVARNWIVLMRDKHVRTSSTGACSTASRQCRSLCMHRRPGHRRRHCWCRGAVHSQVRQYLDQRTQAMSGYVWYQRITDAHKAVPALGL